MAETTLSGAATLAKASARIKVQNINAPLWRNAIFVLPYLFFFVTLLVVPLFWGIWLSLHKADAFGVGRFVGIDNYFRLFRDKIFIQAIGNTFYFVLLTVPALAIIGLMLALA
jgi:multiple sugar transport system permease protein